MTSHALIIGADGGIGRQLEQSLKSKGWHVLGTSRRRTSSNIHLDLTDPAALDNLPAADVYFVCAAMTGQAACEADRATARRVNVDAPVAIAGRAAAAGGHTIFLSSSAVFDGSQPLRTADTPPCPLNQYGRQKAEAENRLRAENSVSIVRLTKILRPDLPLFVNWIQALHNRQQVTAFDDLMFSPVAVQDVVDILEVLGRERPPGVFQVSGPCDISYFQACRYIARCLRVEPSRVIAGSARDAGVPAESRPRHTSMDTSRLSAVWPTPLAAPLEVIGRVFGLIDGPQSKAK